MDKLKELDNLKRKFTPDEQIPSGITPYSEEELIIARVKDLSKAMKQSFLKLEENSVKIKKLEQDLEELYKKINNLLNEK